MEVYLLSAIPQATPHLLTNIHSKKLTDFVFISCLPDMSLTSLAKLVLSSEIYLNQPISSNDFQNSSSVSNKLWSASAASNFSTNIVLKFLHSLTSIWPFPFVSIIKNRFFSSHGDKPMLLNDLIKSDSSAKPS